MAIIASSLTDITSSGRISGSGLARAKMRGLSAIDLTISGDTRPPLDKPKKTSEPTMASEILPSGRLLTNSALYSFNSPDSSLVLVKIPFESTITMLALFTPNLT